MVLSFWWRMVVTDGNFMDHIRMMDILIGWCCCIPQWSCDGTCEMTDVPLRGRWQGDHSSLISMTTMMIHTVIILFVRREGSTIIGLLLWMLPVMLRILGGISFHTPNHGITRHLSCSHDLVSRKCGSSRSFVVVFDGVWFQLIHRRRWTPVISILRSSVGLVPPHLFCQYVTYFTRQQQQ